MGMEIGIEKCIILIMKRGSRARAEGIERPNQERIRTCGKLLEKIGSKYQTSRHKRKNKSDSEERE